MSEIKVNSIKGVGASSAAITVNNTDGTCTANITNNLSNRRLTINGDMRIAQRSTSKNTTGASSAYGTVDRMQLQIQSGTITESQQDLATSDSPYSLGFRKFYRLLNQSGVGAGAAQYVQIDHVIEAQDIATSGWNYTSSSSFITLSFWVRASVTQAYYGRVMAHDGTQRHFSYKICDSGGTTLTADTWTKITVTVPGNSGLTFNNDNGVGLRLSFVPYYGTNYTSSSSSLNAWSASGSGYDYFPDNTTTWATTTNATFDITGIQLEVGSVATDFEHRSIGQELALCQRYFVKYKADASLGGYNSYGTGYQGSTSAVINIPYQSVLRAAPTVVLSGTHRILPNKTGSPTVASHYMGTNNGYINLGNLSGGSANTAAMLSADNDANAFLSLSAEL